MATKIRSVQIGSILIQSGYGIPTHVSTKGSLYIDLDEALLYINKDNASLWVEELDSLNSLQLTQDQYNAITGATSPSSTNVFATIADLNAGSGDTKEVKASSTDTTPSFLNGKLTGSTNIIISLINSGGNEKILFEQTGLAALSGASFLGVVTAPSFSASSITSDYFYGNGSNLTGISTQDTKVTGGTYTDGTATFTNNTGGTFTVTGLTKDQSDITKDFTGFVSLDDNLKDINIMYDQTERTITLVNSDPISGRFKMYFQGTEILDIFQTQWTSDPHPTGVTTTQYLYYDGTNFVWGDSIWKFWYAQVASVSFDATGFKFAGRECHGLMDWECHEHFHDNIGTVVSSGGDLSGYILNNNLAVNKRPLISATVLSDEDLYTSLSALGTNSYTIMNLSGANSTSIYTTGSTEFVLLSGNNPYYNNYTASAWTQTLLPTNGYMCMWLLAIPVTSDSDSQLYRYLWVQGQTFSSSLVTQQSLLSSSINLGGLSLLANEYTFIAKAIIRNIGTNWTIIQIDRLRGNRIQQTSTPAGNFLSSISTDTTLTGDGTSGNVLGVNTNLSITALSASTSITTPIIKPTTNSTTAIKVTKADGITSVISVDTTNSRVGIGATPTSILTLKGTTETDAPTLGVELITSAQTWTSSGWTGDTSVGFKHQTGNVLALTNDTLAPTITTYYLITFTVTGRTAGSFTISFGGVTSPAFTASDQWGPLTTTTGGLIITPLSTFDGNIVISVKQIPINQTPIQDFKNSAGTNFLEIRGNSTTQSTFVGLLAGVKNLGLHNQAFGYNTMFQNTTGFQNNAFGRISLYSNTTGNYNNGFGYGTLRFNIDGIGNTAVGNNAMQTNVSGNYNVALGYQSCYGATTASGNVGAGFNTLFANTISPYNTALGYESLRFLVDGSGNNVGIGRQALYNLTGGTGNIGIGYASGRLAATNNELYIDSIARTTNAVEKSNAIVYGVMATAPLNQRLYLNAKVGIGMGGSASTATLHVHNTGADNNYIKITNSDTTTAIARGLDIGITTAEKAIIWNYENTDMDFATSGLTRLTIKNTGNFTLTKNGTINGLNVGTGTDVADANNTAFGFGVLDALIAVSGSSSQYNTGIGYNSLTNVTTGYQNVGLGSTALFTNVSGLGNTALGHGTLYTTTGSSNIAIGLLAGRFAESSNELYIDNRFRTNNTNEKAQSIVYGVMASTPANQSLYLNAKTYINNLYSLPTTSGNTGDILMRDTTNTTVWSSGYTALAEIISSHITFTSVDTDSLGTEVILYECDIPSGSTTSFQGLIQSRGLSATTTQNVQAGIITGMFTRENNGDVYAISCGTSGIANNNSSDIVFSVDNTLKKFYIKVSNGGANINGARFSGYMDITQVIE